AALMEQVAPAGSIYQAGTLSGNPLAVAAGLKTLEIIRRPGFYKQLESTAAKLTEGLAAEATAAGVPLTMNRAGSMLTAFLASCPVTDYASAKRSDTQAFALFFRKMLDRGIYLPPSQFEAAFISSAHSEEDAAGTIDAAREAFKAVSAARKTGMIEAVRTL
ncbi:MAG: aminotransferase class III-fold pyridoxal phosphate-dependent enzyme, partial [Terriglobia bacterium]